ncbi:MAG: transporter substrate-binding domain-containing protein [Clostridia bacterium]|nr:transporter substrate-binding domain-containing protein [Clostridia bacterium]
MKKFVRAAVLFMMMLALLCLCGFSAAESAQQERQIIRVGIRDTIRHNTHQTGVYDSIDIELVTEAFRRMGYEPEFVPIQRSKMKQMLTNCKVDCVLACDDGSLDLSEYAYSDHYINGRLAVMVPAKSSIKTLADLKGVRMAVRMDSQCERYFDNHGKIGMLLTFPSLTDAVDAMRYFHAEAVAGDMAEMMCLTGRDRSQYRLLEDYITTGQKCVLFDKVRGAQWVEPLNNAFRAMRADGFTEAVIEKHGAEEASFLEGVE